MSGGSKKQETDQTTVANQQQSGTNTQDRSGNFTNQQSQYQRVVAPEGWEDAWRALDLGPGGLTPAQQAALDALQGNVGGAGRALAGPTSLINAAATGESGYGETYSLAQLQKQFPDLYGKIADVTAQTVTPERVSATTIAPERVSAQTGAEFMDLYRNPFEDQVVTSALDDLERKYALDATARGNARQAAGAFGGSASALGDALATNDYLRTVAATSGNLRSQGFNTAASLGMTDAQRMLQAAGMNQTAALEASRLNQATGLQAAGMNQDAGLRAGGMNQSAALQAATQNQNNQTQRQEFDVNAAYKGQDTRNQAVKDWASTVASALGIDNQTALALIGAAGTGQMQGLNWLNMGSRLFGQDGGSTSSGTTDEHTDGSFATTGNSTSNTKGTITQTSSPGLLDVVGALGGLATGLGGLGWKPF